MSQMDKVLDVFLSAADAEANNERIVRIDCAKAALDKERKALVAENVALRANRKTMVFDLMNSMSYQKFKRLFGL